eukprot:1159359-Pelagomonas_calceolata.AAC.7
MASAPWRGTVHQTAAGIVPAVSSEGLPVVQRTPVHTTNGSPKPQPRQIAGPYRIARCSGAGQKVRRSWTPPRGAPRLPRRTPGCWAG